PGSGLGSSAASAAAAIVGVNVLLNNPSSLKELLVHGMAGEAASAGVEHADNVAPALFGGIILIRSYNPLDILELPVPDSLFSTTVLPDFTVNTREARSILPKHVPLKTAIAQAGNLAGFTLALHNGDFDLLGRSMVDHLAEPHRAKLIPGYDHVRQSAIDTGAIGCGISGSGPSVFALSDSLEKAEKIGLAMVNAFKNSGLTSQSYCSPIHTQPPEILS
ncbi:MAG: homoserine kinase, partial [Candidatus Marinimicrobia bacterium]|nr:homoserine kinase [Candidatus Neomarinimicrobiota bacterium]